VPSNVIASTFKFAKAEYFEVEEAEVRAAPAVDFGGTSATGQVPPGSQPPPAVES
jgi:LemA protein